MAFVKLKKRQSGMSLLDRRAYLLLLGRRP